MKATPELYLDIPLVPTDDEGGPEVRLRLERSEIAKGGFGYQANFTEDGHMMLSAGLGLNEPMFLWAYLHHVSAGAIALPACYAAVANLSLHQTALCVRAYNHKGGTDFAFKTWCDGGALFAGWGWIGLDAKLCIGSARFDEAAIAGMRRMVQDMVQGELKGVGK